MNVNINKVFIYACNNGHIDICKHVYEIKTDIYISANNEYAFRYACAYGHIDVAKWLLEVKPDIDISINNDEIFRYACYNGHIDIAKWLVSLKPQKYSITINDNKIISYHINKLLNIDGNIYVDNIDKCPICYEHDVNIMFSCNHMYCTNCINQWLMTHNTCPTCRSNINNDKFKYI